MAELKRFKLVVLFALFVSVAVQANTPCEQLSEHDASALTSAIEKEQLRVLTPFQQQVSSQCQQGVSKDVQRFVDATLLLTTLHHAEATPEAAIERLLSESLETLSVRWQSIIYQLVAKHRIRQNDFKQGLSLTHMLSSEILPAIEGANQPYTTIALANIHYQIAFHQSVRQLLAPLLTHEDQTVRLKAAVQLWYTPQHAEQLSVVLEVLSGVEVLPNDLLKAQILVVLGMQAAEEQRWANANKLITEARELANTLNAHTLNVELALFSAAKMPNSPMELPQHLDANHLNGLSLSQRLGIIKLRIEEAQRANQLPTVISLQQQALEMKAQIITNNALAKEYASFQLVKQAHAIAKANQLAEIQSLAAEKQQQSRIIIALALICTLLVLVVVSLLLVKKQKDAKKFEYMANTDGLTGVLNRRAIQDYTEQLIANPPKENHAFVVAIADIDHFKAINDNYGHDVGDIVLKAFAERGAGLIRQQDKMGRWGGEEWLFVLPATQIAAVNGLFKRLQSAVHNIEANGKMLTVTFSMGAVESQGGKSAEELVQAADELLYKAKHNGRNQLCVVL